MNERLNLQDLVDILSRKKDISKKDAERFLRELFALIVEVVAQKQLIKIKNFGTFKLVVINARKSVDINTKEDIEIPAHYKLTFTPDKHLRDSVNKPFAHFESVLLNDGVVFPELEISDSSNEDRNNVKDDNIKAVENKENKEKKKSTNPLVLGLTSLSSIFKSKKSTTKKGATENNEEDNQQTLLQSNHKNNELMKDNEIDDTLLPEELTNAEDEKVFNAPKISGAISEAVEAMENLSDDEHLQEKDENENNESNKNVESMEEDYENWKEEEEKKRIEEAEERKRFEEWKIKQRELMNSEESIESDEDMSEMVTENKSKKRGIFLYFLALLFLILLVLILIFSARNKRSTPEQNLTEQTQSVNDEEGYDDNKAEQTVTNANKEESVPEDNDQNQSVISDDNEIISTPPLVKENDKGNVNAVDKDDLPMTIYLKRGETLRLLSEKYYGNRTFWVYIYEENKNVITNPNGLYVGMKLVIPSKAKYGIDANNTESLRKAKQLENELYSQFR